MGALLSNNEEKYVIYLAGFEFTFRTVGELEMFVQTMFRFAEDKKALYLRIAHDTVDLITRDCESAIPPESAPGSALGDRQLLMLRGLSQVKNRYGQIYDPDQTAFKVVEDEDAILG